MVESLKPRVPALRAWHCSCVLVHMEWALRTQDLLVARADWAVKSSDLFFLHTPELSAFAFYLDSDSNDLILFPPVLLCGERPPEELSLRRVRCPPLPLLDRRVNLENSNFGQFS